MQKIIDRFVKYVQVDTQSDANNPDFPSTEKQWDLAHILVDELKEIGMQDVTLDEHCYIMATLPSNVDFKVPTIGFIAHIDTSPDYSGTNVKPQIHKNYDGGDILLNKAENIVLSPSYFEDLLLYKGQTLITTDGTTLLGADDKAGITEIVSAMEYLINHKEIKHGKIRIGFTPDEEVGKGAHMFDVDKFGAEWAYTLDGSQIGELEYENFNAASAKVTISGQRVPPGSAKNKMVNAISIATEFLEILPPEETPQRTEGREGFFHVHHLKGGIEHAEFELIVRDHDATLFKKRKQLLRDIATKLNSVHGNCIALEIKDQYFNMRQKVEPVMHIVDIAKKAMEAVGVTPIIKP